MNITLTAGQTCGRRQRPGGVQDRDRDRDRDRGVSTRIRTGRWVIWADILGSLRPYDDRCVDVDADIRYEMGY